MGTTLSRFFRSLSRSCVSWTLVVLVFWPFLATPAQAQLSIVADVPRQTDNLLNTIFTSLTRAAMVGFFNAAQTFLGQLAYDAADYIATGSSGQAATYYKKSVGSYLAGVASDAAGEFIGSLSSEDFFRTAGLDLCRPSAQSLLRLQLSLGNFFPGMQGRFQRPRPRCDFKSIIRNYDQLYQSLSNEDVLKNVQLSVNTNSSDLGATLNILNQARLKVNLETANKKADRQEGGGFKSITNILSGNVKTPAQVVNEAARTELVKFPKDSLLTQIGATLSSGMEQGFIQLASYTASIFVNTLTSKLLKRVFESGLDDGVAQLQLSADQVTQTRPTDTRNLKVSLKTPNLQKVENFDVVTELASCPNETRGTWNCTIDQGFRSALVRNDQGGVTVRTALASGLLHGDWQLIPISDLRRNQDRECYTHAYCAGNLEKLRLLRMLPIGFEVAANSAENARRCGPQGGGCVTLQEVVDGFTACSGSSAPWCHLIDPDWIITALPQQCVLKGYGDQLISSTLGQRREECQDVQTCLRRNDQGECVGGYGYCVAEKTVYRFGADECLPRQASCRTYQTRGGGDVSYLRNTVDQATCSADNVGCLWYATTRDPAGGAEGWVGNTSTGPRIYLNAKVEGCSASGEGCTSVREAVTGRSSLNLVINPSFESFTDATPAALKGWIPLPAPSGGALPLVSPTVAAGVAHDGLGDHAADLNAPGGARVAYFQGVSMAPSRSYVLSFSARAKVAGRASHVSTVVTQSSNPVGLPLAPVFDRNGFKSAGCVVVAIGETRSIGSFAPAPSETLPTDWQRFECTFVTTSSTKAGLVSILGDGTVLDSNVLVDRVQLEEGEYATDFIDGVNMSLTERHLKIAPDEFACTGEDTDVPMCDRFAKVCRQIEAGCNGYTDAITGGTEIPAILSTNDLCPSECVGYAEYRKSPSAFDLVKDPDDRFSDPSDTTSSYFIASTAASCRREEVGCEAFTNVEGTRGEQQAFLTYARSCRKPGPASQTFFTWEGSDTSGYQLRTWSLVHDTATPPAPLILTKREPGSLSVKEPATCNDSTWRTALDPDCRQFYDADGHVSYRYYSQTILSTPSCTDFRVARNSRADCERTDGVFDATANECLYHVYLPLSQVCTASVVGCREYRGVTAGANLPIIDESFRGATNTHGFVGARLSNETLLVGDQSLRLDVPARTGASIRVPFVTPAGDGQYSVTFWAKPALATSTLQITVRDPADATRTPTVVGSVLLTTDWQRYTVGPFFGYPGAPTSSLVWTASGNTNPYVVFLDEVSLVRIQDRTYVRRDSWSTPNSCDQNAYGVPQSQGMLGCRTYRSRDNQSVNVKDFTRLCRQAAIGCKAFVDSRNSADVGSQTFEKGDTPIIPGFGTATTIHPADRMLYLIDDPTKRCTSDQDSCRALGKPQFSADRTNVTGFSTVYVKDDITRYDQSLCRPSELFCEEFTHSGSKEYFRNPDNHVCEYREQVTGVVDTPGGTYSGWFEVGSNPPKSCYPTLLESGQTFGIARRADLSYRGWVGMCEPEAAECTELRDPIDVSDEAHPSGKPYYFIRNEHLDASTCAGNVDRANGCILMRDTGSEDIRYNARATYGLQQAMSRPTPVQPIDCVRNPADPNCRAQKGHCVGTIRYCPLTDPDCARTPSVPGSLSPTGALLGNVWPMSFADVLWSSNPELLSLLDCRTDSDCNDRAPTLAPDRGSLYRRSGTCKVENDANLIVKVNVDRDCAQWLGCSSSEVVLDPATNRSRSLCTNLALCNKGSQDAGDQYCDGYVNRGSTSTEPVLTQGTALTQPLYTSRAVGLGEKDYSGYAIPNAFLPTDLVNARVAIDGTNGDTRATSKFARDYRLVAAVAMPPAHPFRPVGLSTCDGSDFCFDHNQPPLQNQAKILDRRTRLGAAYPNLHLCQHLQTNLIGYFIPQKMAATTTSFCYLASSFDPATVTDPDIRRSPYDFNSLALGFTETDANNDGFVRQAFPSAECRANPEADSPFAADYVTAWDFTKNPPKPTQRVPGFTRVNVCEFGQDCSCTYKRADYNQAAVSKFFNANAQTVPSGVCVGGPRDGEACIPGEIANAAGDASGAAVPAPVITGTGAAATASIPERKRASEASNVSQTCGDAQLGGRCVILSRVETVRGVFGQCLQRDVTRTVTIGNTNEQPCLAWNPGPILFGEHDTFHYSPSAGYQPPPGSGQYYCLSATRKPTTMRFDPSDFVGVEPPAPLSFGSMSVTAAAATAGGNPAGLLTLLGLRSGPAPTPVAFSGRMTQISYDDNYVSRETENASGKASILGHSGKEGQSARDCEDADDEQDIDNQARDIHGLRLVGTGADVDHSYTESFFAINQKKYVSDLFNEPTPNASLVTSGMMDSNIGYIKIQPFENPNGIGRLGCGYQADWVDGAPATNYDDKESLRSGDPAWRQKFFANYSPLLTRGSEKYFTKDSGAFVTRPCVKTDPNSSTEPSKTCGFKYWELGYRSEGQSDLFNGAFMGTDRVGYDEGFEELRKRPFSTKCSAEKPYFAVRAVFQAESTRSDVRPSGPWRFVGFWVASCAGRVNDVRYMYMNVDVVSADICKELAEVRSKDSLQDAAYTDRVWKGADYTAPRIGTQYNSKFAPFASAVTSRPISEAGIEPLFQAGGDVAGFSPLKPPTFLAPGSDTYHRPEPLPKDKWAYLSNLFARVYRVYRYYGESVALGDKACLDGPFKGEACVTDVATALSGPSKQCSIQGVCDTNLLESSAIDTFKMCDAMSGLNAGVSCADDPDVCHTGAVFFGADGISRQQLSACVLNRAMWSQNSDDGTYNPRATAASTEHYSATEASQQYLRDRTLNPPFVCQGGMRRGQDCSGIATLSRECPEEILGKCVVPHAAPRSPDHFEVRLNEPVINVPNSVTSTKCAIPRYVRGPDVPDTSPGARPGAPYIPGTSHIVNSTVPADGFNPLDHPEKVYVDPTTHLVYDVVTNDEYTSCQADYDCSFTGYNYYTKRPDGYAPLFSVRSRRYQWQRGLTYSNYGPVLGSDGGGCDNNTATNECMRETYIDVAGCQGGELTPVGARIWTGGPRRAASLLPWRVVSSADSISDYERSNIVGAVDQRCSVQAWRQGLARNPGDAYDQTNACGQSDYHDYDYQDALVSETGGVSEISPHVLSELTRDPGVNHTAFRTPSDRDLFDQILNIGPACLQTAQWINVPFGTCVSPKDLSRSKSYGRCRGGAKDGSLCRVGSQPGDSLSCEYRLSDSLVPAGAPPLVYTRLGNESGDPYRVTRTDLPMSTLAQYEAAVNRCGPVSIDLDGGRLYRPVAACAQNGTTQPTGSSDLDNDNNICTHTAGYKPRVDLCPDPSDEFCGLIAYKRGNVASLTPGASPFPLATDVTVGHYTPDYLLNSADRPAFQLRFGQDSLSYINFYRPYPPQVAAVDVNQCRQAGQCAVTRAQTFAFNGQTEGPLVIAGGQHKSTVQFYAWASHNQMPIRKMMIDWGDGFVQSLPDAKIKNHKPFCGGTKECYIVTGPNKGHTGLTCNTDTDCPSGYGRCENMGTCVKQADKTCTQDTDCTGGTNGVVGDRCNVRQFFGNSSEACEQNYFEFSHVYTCEGQRSVSELACDRRAGSSAQSRFSCARNPDRLCTGLTDVTTCGAGDQCIEDLAPKGGCWDDATRACRFTPRVLIEDNWGWCTGECRSNVITTPAVGDTPASTQLSDDPASTPADRMAAVTHPYGGCYAGIPVNAPRQDAVRLNTDQSARMTFDECSSNYPGDGSFSRYRPWIVYPGSLQLRSR